MTDVLGFSANGGGLPASGGFLPVEIKIGQKKQGDSKLVGSS
jgi:hypothetical protein